MEVASMLMRWDPVPRAGSTHRGGFGQRRAHPDDGDGPRSRRGDEFVVEFDLPGIDPGSIELTVEKNVLSVKAERQRRSAEGLRSWVVAERPTGGFTRQLFLGYRNPPSRADLGPLRPRRAHPDRPGRQAGQASPDRGQRGERRQRRSRHRHHVERGLVRPHGRRPHAREPALTGGLSGVLRADAEERSRPKAVMALPRSSL